MITMLRNKLRKLFYFVSINLRILILRIRGVKFGKNNFVDSKCRFVLGKGQIEIGDNNEFMHGALLMTYGGVIRIGNSCSINPYTIIYGHGEGVTIANNVLIAGHCMIIPSTHNHSRLDIPINQQGGTSKGIVIEDNVWIGAGCKLLYGVTIGTGSIIAAGSVVNKSIESNSIAGGLPATIIRKRSDA